MDEEEKALVAESLHRSIREKETLLLSVKQPLLDQSNNDATRLRGECEELKRQINALKRAAAHLGGEIA